MSSPQLVAERAAPSVFLVRYTVKYFFTAGGPDLWNRNRHSRQRKG